MFIDVNEGVVPTKEVFLEVVDLNSLLREVEFCGTISVVPEECVSLYDWIDSVAVLFETEKVGR